MKKPIYFLYLVIGVMLMAYVISLSFVIKELVTVRRDFERIKVLNDSMEVKEYRKLLETYPYDHSEIKDTLKF